MKAVKPRWPHSILLPFRVPWAGFKLAHHKVKRRVLSAHHDSFSWVQKSALPFECLPQLKCNNRRWFCCVFFPPLPLFCQRGFGNIDGEHWLGLDNIYNLGKQGDYKLMVELEDWTGKKVYAEYSSFHIESESEGYRLRLGTYQGNAGDSFSSHNGKQFTTLDRDRDAFSGERTDFAMLWFSPVCCRKLLIGPVLFRSRQVSISQSTWIVKYLSLRKRIKATRGEKKY